MKTTGEIVFACHREKEDRDFLYLYTPQQGGSLNKENKIKLSCAHYLNMLIVQIQWREYLVISCKECRDIKLVDLDTNEVTTAYSDEEQELGRMCKGGWHKIYVEVPSGLLELDCTSTKFTKMRQIQTGKYGLTSCYELCYVPPPHNLIVADGKYEVRGNMILHATYLDEPNKTLWQQSGKKMDGKIISADGIIYSSRHDALVVADGWNCKVWVLSPTTGEILQTTDVPGLGAVEKAFIRGMQLIIVSFSSGNVKINYFSLN